MTNLVLPAAPTVPAAMRALDAMQLELSQAATYEQIGDVIRKAEALRVLFKEVEEVEHRAQLTIVLGKRRIGEELKKVPKAHKHQSSKLGKSTTDIKPTERHRMGKLAGISEKAIRETSAALQATGKDATVSSVIKEITHGSKAQRRETRQKELAGKIKALPRQQFGVIYADPATRFKTHSERGLDRAADNHYPTQEMSEIAALPVSDIAAKDCVLFLWTTVPMLQQSLQLVLHWGFEYKSMLTWNKVVPGKGYWFRNQTEHLIVATRGNFVAPGESQRMPSLFTERKGRHSAKPDGIADWITATWPDVPRIELNARGPRDGWIVWGNEAT